MQKIKVNELFKVQANEYGDLLLIIRNKTTQKLSEIKLAKDNNIIEYCYYNNIDASSYKKSTYKAIYSDDTDEKIHNIIYNALNELKKRNESEIPMFQKNRDKINEFVYNLLVFKNYIINSDIKYKNCYDIQYKLSKRMYFKNLYNQYLKIRKQFFDNSFYSELAIKNLNKNMYRFILANI